MADEQEQCVFCHIATGKIPAKKVYEDDKVTAVLDINPASPGHILLLTKEHVSVMPQMSDDLVSHVGMVSKQLSQALLRSIKAEGTSIFVANGVAAGQRAPHFMMHIIPRSKSDQIALQWPPGNVTEANLREVAEKISASVEKQFGIKLKLEEKKVEEKPEEKQEAEEKEPEKKIEEKPEKKEEKSSLDDIADLLTGK